ncbi:rhodanese-like domain-containing protein [Micromonospora sp. MS34]|uniref:rhodanese-like domain-containing protein n=1 Tax=Micromonospora sp. MS34 TaxID=3385971 RepID=UPI0039A330BE
MDFEVFTTPGLGDNSYLLRSGDEAVLVDPQRDAWRFLAAAEKLGVRVRAVLETHVHNDYVSGAHEVRAATGAELVLPARGGYEFPHRPVDEGDEVAVGDLRLVAMATPGHTPEHLAWLAHQPGTTEPRTLFSGGSLLVGSAGRTDLLGPDLTDRLTRDQHATLARLAALPDDVRVLPTHGAGSFCVAAMPSTSPTSLIGTERQRNPLLLATDFAGFAEELSGELMAYPSYYTHMAPINRAGAPALGTLPQPPEVTPADVTEALRAGVWVVDARDRAAFAAAHIPGSVNIELNSGFASYVGWLLPFDAPMLLILPEPAQESLPEVMTQLIRIGWSNVKGYLPGGVERWRSHGGDVSSYPLVSADDLCDAYVRGEQPAVLDVRQPLEWQWGRIPGSRTVFVADLPAHLHELARTEPVWVICSNGHRAAVAASLLDRAAVPVRLVGDGGVGEWRVRCRSRRAASV